MGNDNKNIDIYISVISPVHNEAENIGSFYARIKPALDELCRIYEIIFVDDGSNDSGYRLLQKIRQKDPVVRLFRHRQRLGQACALKTGIDNSRGKIIVTIDADLQSPPEYIQKLLEKIEAGYDVVNAWRNPRNEPYLTKILPSKLANFLINLISGASYRDQVSSFKAYRADILKQVKLMAGLHRYILYFCYLRGANISEVAIPIDRRTAGKSKYGVLSRFFVVLLDLLSLHFFKPGVKDPLIYFSFITLFCLSFYISIKMLTAYVYPGLPTMLANLTFYLMCIFICIGIAVKINLNRYM